MKTRYDKLAIWRYRDGSIWYVFKVERKTSINRIGITNGWINRYITAGNLKKEYTHSGYSNCVPSFSIEREYEEN